MTSLPTQFGFRVSVSVSVFSFQFLSFPRSNEDAPCLPRPLARHESTYYIYRHLIVYLYLCGMQRGEVIARLPAQRRVATAASRIKIKRILRL